MNERAPPSAPGQDLPAPLTRREKIGAVTVVIGVPPCALAVAVAVGSLQVLSAMELLVPFVLACTIGFSRQYRRAVFAKPGSAALAAAGVCLSVALALWLVFEADQLGACWASGSAAFCLQARYQGASNAAGAVCLGTGVLCGALAGLTFGRRLTTLRILGGLIGSGGLALAGMWLMGVAGGLDRWAPLR